MKSLVQDRALTTIQVHLTVWLRAGVTATFALVIGDGIFDVLGLPFVDYAGRFGAHFFLFGGLFLPLGYAFLSRYLPGAIETRTVLLGLLQWFILAPLVVPGSPSPLGIALVALAGQLFYTGILDSMTRLEKEDVLELSTTPRLSEEPTRQEAA